MGNSNDELIKDLKDTVDLMNSGDYQDRFKAEYFQTKIRLEKLHNMLIKIDAGTLDFTPNSPKNVLQMQENYMRQYLNQLEVRAQYEHIELN